MIIVVSTVEPGRKRAESENGDSLDSMVNGDLSLDVNVDIDMEADSIFSLDAQQQPNENASNNVGVLTAKNNESDESNAIFNSNDNENKEDNCSRNNVINSESTKENVNEEHTQLSSEGNVMLNANVCPVVNVNDETVSNEDDTTVPHPKKVKLDLSLTEEKSVVQDNREEKSPTSDEGIPIKDQIIDNKLPNTLTNSSMVTDEKNTNLVEDGTSSTTVVVTTPTSEALPTDLAVLTDPDTITETSIATNVKAQPSTSSSVDDVSELQKEKDKEFHTHQDTEYCAKNDENEEKKEVSEEEGSNNNDYIEYNAMKMNDNKFTHESNENATDKSEDNNVDDSKTTEEILLGHAKGSPILGTEITGLSTSKSEEKLSSETRNEKLINDETVCKMEENQNNLKDDKENENISETKNLNTLSDVGDGKNTKSESVGEMLDNVDKSDEDADSGTMTKTEVKSDKGKEKENDPAPHSDKTKTDEKILLMEKIDETISNNDTNIKTNQFVGTVLNSITEEESVISNDITKETVCTTMEEKLTQDQSIAKVLPRTPTKVEITPTPLLNQSSFDNAQTIVPIPLPLDSSAVQVAEINDQLLEMVAEEEDIPIEEEDIQPTLEEVVMAEPPLSSVLAGTGAVNLVGAVIADTSQVGAISNLSPTAMATEDELLSTVIVGSKMNEEEPAGMEVDDNSQEAMDQ